MKLYYVFQGNFFSQSNARVKHEWNIRLFIAFKYILEYNLINKLNFYRLTNTVLKIWTKSE